MASTPKLPNFKQLQLGFQTSQRGTKKKENHLHTISKMMGTLVHVQLYTFSYRKPVIRPQNMPKTADWGQKRSKLWYFKMGPQVQPKCFRHVALIYFQKMLQVLTSHTSKLPKKVLKNTKNMTPNSCSVRPEKFHPNVNRDMSKYKVFGFF